MAGIICKAHKKPRDQAWSERQEHGGMLMRVGCVDCRAEAIGKPPRPSKRQTQVKSFVRRWF